MCAYINYAFKEYDIEQINLQRNLQHHICATINTLVKLGISYENTSNYEEAFKRYFTILDIINYVFTEDDYVPPFYRTEDGNIYGLIARTYLAMGNTDEYLNYLEKMVHEEMHLGKVKEFVVKNKFLDKAKLTNFANYMGLIEECNVLYVLNLECFDSVKDNERYKKLLEIAEKLN